MAVLVNRSMVGEAQQVTGTTARLVQVATECQRVIAKAQGSGASGQKGRAYYADGTWSEGMGSHTARQLLRYEYYRSRFKRPVTLCYMSFTNAN